MSDAFGERPFPRAVLIAVGSLIAFTIIMIAIARITGVMLPQAPILDEVQGRDISFVEQADGGLAVYDVATKELITTLPPGGEGFIRGMLRSLERQRMGYQAADTEPYRVARRANGHVTLADPVTGQLLDLRAYGETNQAAFAALLPPPPEWMMTDRDTEQ